MSTSYEEVESTVVRRDGTLLQSRDAQTIAEAVRDVLASYEDAPPLIDPDDDRDDDA